MRSRRIKGTPPRFSEAIQKFPFPVIAMLYGYTLGAGCVLAMACDMRIASKNVRMGIPTSRMGLISSQRGFKRFLNVLGYSTALEIFLTGRSYDSQDCLAMGLVNHLVDQDELESYTYKLADEITRCAPLSLRALKHTGSRIADHPVSSQKILEPFGLSRCKPPPVMIMKKLKGLQETQTPVYRVEPGPGAHSLLMKRKGLHFPSGQAMA